jgi:YHS domain-containing protein
MNRHLIASGLTLGLAFAALGLAAAPQTRPAAVQDTEKKEATCTVCGRKIDKDKGQKVSAKGKDHLVCSEACAKALTQDPDKYLNEDGTRKH